MRILILTNFYPPDHRGGMGLSCQSVVEGLRARGHTVCVLTSRSQRDGRVEEGVARKLWLEMSLEPLRNALDFFLFRRRRQASNLEVLRRTVGDFDPGVVFVWGMWNLDPVLARTAEDLCQNRVVYRFADYWPLLPSQLEEYWREPGRTVATRLLRRVLAPIALSTLKREKRAEPRFPYSYCVSEAVRQKLLGVGLPVERSPVIHTGFELEPFLDVSADVSDPGPSLRRILFIGRLVPQKGVQVALEAVARLRRRGENFDLTIVGAGEDRFVENLEAEVVRRQLGSQVRLLGSVPSADIPAVMQDHGVVVVPSLWEDPLPRVAIEAMAAARVLIASHIGGLPEIVEPGNTGILFEPGDTRALAAVLLSLARNPGRAREIARAARRAAIEKFEFEASLEQIELLLRAVVDQPASAIDSDRPLHLADGFSTA